MPIESFYGLKPSPVGESKILIMSFKFLGSPFMIMEVKYFNTLEEFEEYKKKSNSTFTYMERKSKPRIIAIEVQLAK